MARKSRSFRAEGVVLHHSDWGEADRLIRLFTRDQGKLRAIAKGARKIRSRKAGHLEPFTRVSLQLARGRDLFIITQAETVDAYLPLRDDLISVGYASYIIELVDRFTYEEGENIPLYNLLTATLERLTGELDREIVTRYFEIRLLDLAGFRPELQHCVSCERKIEPEDQFFDFASGGVLCPQCGPTTRGARAISMRALKYLRHFQRSNFHEATKARVQKTTQRELENLMHDYLTYLLERRLNSPAFLRRVRSG